MNWLEYFSKNPIGETHAAESLIEYLDKKAEELYGRDRMVPSLPWGPQQASDMADLIDSTEWYWVWIPAIIDYYLEHDLVDKPAAIISMQNIGNQWERLVQEAKIGGLLPNHEESKLLRMGLPVSDYAKDHTCKLVKDVDWPKPEAVAPTPEKKEERTLEDALHGLV